MPIYKESAKKVKDRKLPFEKMDSDLMNVAFHYLSTTDIDKYVKLDKSHAGEKIDKIKKKLNLESYEQSIPDMISIIKTSCANHDHQRERVYKMLFVIFTALMERDYNGIIRQLTKLFIE